jgi:hypothetical protein
MDARTETEDCATILQTFGVKDTSTSKLLKKLRFDKVPVLRSLLPFTQKIGLSKRVVYYNEGLVEGTGPSSAIEWLVTQYVRWAGGTLKVGQYNYGPQLKDAHVSLLQQYADPQLRALRQSFIDYYRRECTDSINIFMGTSFFATVAGGWAGPMALSPMVYQALGVFLPAFFVSTGDFYYEASKTIERDTGEPRGKKLKGNAWDIFCYTSALSWNFPQGYNAKKKSHEPKEFAPTRVGATVKQRPPKESVYWQTRGLASNLTVGTFGLATTLIPISPLIPIAGLGLVMFGWGCFNVLSWIAAQSIRSEVKNDKMAKRDQIVQRLGMTGALREAWNAEKGRKWEMLTKWGPFAALEDCYFYASKEPWAIKIARCFNPKGPFEN